MIVVSDSTTLIILANHHRFAYLENLFSHIVIPSAVYAEIKEITLPPFITVEYVAPSNELLILKQLLDEGESEAIALAKSKNLPLIIDEKKGRKIAKNLHLTIIGLLGILYLNHKKGFISHDEMITFLDEAQKQGYRIAQKLIDDMLNSLA